jgi:hypothetical protein
MKINPLINALAALSYIGLVVTFIRFMESTRHDTPDTPLDGLAFISLFTFSAAVMAFIFFYQPVLKLTEHKPQEALTYFLKTLGYFGLITASILTLASLQ